MLSQLFNDRMTSIFSEMSNMDDSIFTLISMLMYIGNINMDHKVSITQ